MKIVKSRSKNGSMDRKGLNIFVLEIYREAFKTSGRTGRGLLQADRYDREIGSLRMMEAELLFRRLEALVELTTTYLVNIGIRLASGATFSYIGTPIYTM